MSPPASSPLALEPTESLTRGQRALEALRFDEARLAYLRALQFAPVSVDALRGLGYALLQLGDLAGSLDALAQALRVDSSDLLSQLLMGRLCLRLQQPAAAATHFRLILERIPHSEAARSGLIDALAAQGELAAAKAESAGLLKDNPNSEVANLAAARLAGFERDDTRALQHFSRLVALRPDHPTHRYNLSLCLLRLGQFEQGWREYEFRFAAGAVHLPLPATPRWDGGPGGHLLIVAEQGLGDTILFARFVEQAAARTAGATLCCPAPLAGLLGRSLPVRVVAWQDGAWPAHDVHIPLMSLPCVLGLGADAALARPAYLEPDPARCAAWRAALGEAAGPRIGIVHATSVAHSTEALAYTRRSCAAADLRALVGLPGVETINLNVGPPADEARRDLPGLRQPPGPLADFDDTAALVHCLDAVVSVDTAGAHLAGAIGTPLVVLLPPAPDWKWQLSANPSQRAPWYGRLQRVQRAADGPWSDAARNAARIVLARLSAEATA
jgi:Flp pilus assembly protein TadD